MTELKEFLLDFDFDDIQLMKEIDQAANEKEIPNGEDTLTVSDPVAATFIKNAAKEGKTLIVLDPKEVEITR